MTPRRLTAGAAAVLVGSLACVQCSRQETRSTTAVETGPQSLTPVLSVRELMAHIDPTADWIFDAAVVDVSATGTTVTAPVSDEDWLKVERGVLTLAEASNLLKMPRQVVPAGTRQNRPSLESRRRSYRRPRSRPRSIRIAGAGINTPMTSARWRSPR